MSIEVNQVFGYIRPWKAELLVREYEQYRGLYCTLCKRMGLAYGRISRLTLSYDCTFLVMVLLGLSDDCPSFSSGRCVVNPTKACFFCSGGEEVFRYAGAVSILLTDAKLRDDLADGKPMEKLRAGFLRMLGHFSAKKAARAFPKLAAQVEEYLQAQTQAEKESPASLDACAHPTATLLAGVLRQWAGEDEKLAVILEQFGYFLGRWVYLMDAADDLRKDLASGEFNPFIGALGLDGIPSLEGEQRRQAEEACNGVLNMTVSRIIAPLTLLEWKRFGPIIENVIYKGLPEMQREILFLHAKEKKHVRSV